MPGTQERKTPAKYPRRETRVSCPAGPQNVTFEHGDHDET